MEWRTPWTVRFRSIRRVLRVWVGLLVVTGCQPPPAGGPVTVTFPSSTLGAEGTVLRRQLARFMQEHPRHTGRAAVHSGRSRPAPSALRAVAQRSRWRARYPPARRDLDSGVRRCGVDSAARSLQAGHRLILPRHHRRQYVAGPPLWDAVVRGRGDAVLADRPHALAASDFRRAGADCGGLAGAEQGAIRPRVPGCEIRGSGHRLCRVSRGPWREDSRWGPGDGRVAGGYRGAHRDARPDLSGVDRSAGHPDLARGGGALRLPERRCRLHAELALPLCLHERQRLVPGRRPVRRGADARRLGWTADRRAWRGAARDQRVQLRIPMRRGRWSSTSRARNRCSSGPASSASSRPGRRSIAIPGFPRRSRCRSIRRSPWSSTRCRGR